MRVLFTTGFAALLLCSTSRGEIGPLPHGDRPARGSGRCGDAHRSGPPERLGSRLRESRRVERRTDDGYDVTGDLTIRDVTRSVAFPVDVERASDTVHARGPYVIVRRVAR